MWTEKDKDLAYGLPLQLTLLSSVVTIRAGNSGRAV
jgi:hypothetical protein